jgi:hypothetical protein
VLHGTVLAHHEQAGWDGFETALGVTLEDEEGPPPEFGALESDRAASGGLDPQGVPWPLRLVRGV